MSRRRGHLKNVCYRGVPVTEVSQLPRCPSYRGVPVTEVSRLPRCPSYRGVPVTEVSQLPRYPSYRGVPVTEVYQLPRCPSYRVPLYDGGNKCKVTIFGRCAPQTKPDRDHPGSYCLATLYRRYYKDKRWKWSSCSTAGTKWGEVVSLKQVK